MKKILLTSLAMLFFISLSYAQKTVNGVVKTSDGDPLIGVNVLEKGTGNGTVTDFDGNFSLNVSEGAILELSYTGYQTQEFTVGSQSFFDISLSEGELLDEVVVTALGIERSERALAYSVTEIEGESLTTAKEVHVGNALAGKIAGVSVSNPATGPGGSSRIVIRGNGNISGNNQPLIVVDGVPINNDNLGSAGMWGGQDWGDGLSSVNADDIETVTVLKGNTAGALYGYRAGNGVILITTKKGKKTGGIGVEFNTNFQAETIIDNYNFQDQYGHGNLGAKPTTQEEAFAQGLYAWGAQLDGSQVMQFDGVERPYSAAGNNLDRFYNPGNTWTNSLALTSGGENFNFRIGMTNLDNKGIMPNSGLNRRTISTNTSATYGKLTASVSGSYINDATQNRPRLSDSPGNANYTAWSLPASINIDDLKGDPDKLGANEEGTELQFNDNVFVTNPWWAAHQFVSNNTKNRVFGNISLAYELAEGLTAIGKVGMDRFSEQRRSVEPYGTAFTNFGAVSESDRDVQEINLELLLNYQHDFSDNFGMNLYAGGNQQKNYAESIGVRGGNLIVPFLHTAKNGANQTFNYGFSQFQINSLFGSAEFSIASSLYLTVTGRQDWFSTLTNPDGSASENSVFYPSVGVSYDLANGLNLPSMIDFMKVRASWASVGGATDPYQLSLNYGVQGQGHLGQPLGAITSGTIPPAGLVPSTNQEFEIGFDSRFFKNKVRLDVAYYNRNTTNGILNASISPTSGYGSKKVNVGEISNKGIEVLLNVTPVSTSKFNWDLGINFANNVNEVVSLLTPEQDDEQIRLEESRTRNAYIHLVEGLPYSQVMGFAYARDAGGNIMLDDNGLPLAGDLMAFGTGVHPTQVGIQNSFSFGDLTVGFLIDVRSGGMIYNATNAYGYFRGLHENTLEGRESGIGAVPAAEVQNYYQRIAFGISEEFIDDASFGKLREVIIGYKLPENILPILPFKGGTVSFAARNLGILWKSTDNIDPESTYTTGNGQGLEMFGVPVTRSYGINLSLTF